ncbi:MAG: phosphatidate cytidylyltransferase, partial [Thermodesulfobacteriota bacterium]
MTSHQTRVITALVLAALLLYFLFFAPPYLMAIGVYILSALGLWEFYSFFPSPRQRIYKLLGIALALPIVLFNFLNIDVAMGVLLSFWLLNITYLALHVYDLEIKWGEFQILACGWLYIPLVLQFLLQISSLEIFFIFVAAIFSDIGAYYFGSWWGRRKLWPKLSPKKTWMGALGGMLGTVAGALIVGVIWGSICWYHWIWIGVLLNLAAQAGDFLESAIKRQYNIKDSGTILPGHGGILDRFDSVL